MTKILSPLELSENSDISQACTGILVSIHDSICETSREQKDYARIKQEKNCGKCEEEIKSDVVASEIFSCLPGNAKESHCKLQTKTEEGNHTNHGMAACFENREGDALEAERIVKAIILDMMDPGDVKVPSLNSDECGSETILKKKKRRKRRKKSKVPELPSTCDLDNRAGLLQNVPHNVSDNEFSGSQQTVVKEFELVDSGSEISQDETYRDSVTSGYRLDLEDTIIKENLITENEKLEKAIKALEDKLSKEMEKSKTMKKSLNEFKSDNGQLQCQKTTLHKMVLEQEETIKTLNKRAESLKNTCESLSSEKQTEIDEKKLEVDSLKSKLSARDEQLRNVQQQYEIQFLKLAKEKEDFLAQLTSEARGLTKSLSKVSGRSSQTRENKGIVEMLHEASEDIASFLETATYLEGTTTKLKENADSQNKTLSKLASEKKSLKEDVFGLNKQNKSLLKDKAKLQREIESLRKDSVKAKNLSQSYKTKLEELKAKIRSIQREKESVVQEKKNIELKLKELGVDHNALKKAMQAKKEKNKSVLLRGRLGEKNHWLMTPRVRDELQQLFLKAAEEEDDLDIRLEQLAMRKRKTKDQLRRSDEIREHLKRNSCRLVQKYEEMCKRSQCLDNVVAKLKNDGKDLRKLVRGVIRENARLRAQTEVLIEQHEAGNMENNALKKSLHQNCGVLARFCNDNKELQAENSLLKTEVTKVAESWHKEVATLNNVREELRNIKKDNEELRSERRKHERTLENYKELVHGYSHVLTRSPGIQGAASEMRTINRELRKFVAIIQKEKEAMSKKVSGISVEVNLIQTIYHTLKRYCGKQSKTSSTPSPESKDPISEKPLLSYTRCLRESIQTKDQVICYLRHCLDTERSEGDKLHENVQKLIFCNEHHPQTPCDAKVSNKMKKTGFLNFKKWKSESESPKKSGALDEKQLSVVINLVQVEQQLTNEIKESLEIETRLDLLAEHGKDYTELLNKRNFETNLSEEKKSYKLVVSRKNEHNRVAELIKEKRRLENELSFKEAHEGLLEKQVALLKKQRKCCTKALKKYYDDVNGRADQSVMSSMVDVLSASFASTEFYSSDNRSGGDVKRKELPPEGKKVVVFYTCNWSDQESEK